MDPGSDSQGGEHYLPGHGRNLQSLAGSQMIWARYTIWWGIV
jgi:hypothetical protein